MRFENEYEFLHPDFLCDIQFAKMRFRSAYAAYQMLRCKNRMARRVFENCDHAAADTMLARYGIADDSDDAKLDAMERAQIRKFQNPALMERLKAIEGEIVWENDTDGFFGVVKGSGENMLGYLLQDIRDGNIEDRPDDDLKDAPVMEHIHPGMVRTLPQDPSRSLVKIPWPLGSCTISALLPTSELQRAEAVVSRGANIGEHYFTACLESESYALVCHDKSGRTITGLVPDRMEALELSQTWRMRMREAARKKKHAAQQTSQHTSGTVRVMRDTRDDIFAGSDIWSDDHSITFSVSSYPNQPMMLRLIIENRVTGASKTISCPPVTDRPLPLLPETIAIDITLFAREVEALCAEGFLLPFMDTEMPNPHVTDAQGRYAFTNYWFNYDLIEPDSESGRALSAYARAVNAAEDVITVPADPNFRAHRAQGRPETRLTPDHLVKRQLRIGKYAIDGDSLRAHAMILPPDA